jgi:tRNA(fMet)-specific endonuclease VapC
MKYMLDTNICVYFIKRKPQSIFETLNKTMQEGVAISSITVAELEYGVAKSEYYEKNKNALAQFLTLPVILPFDVAAAAEYGNIRVELQRRGTPIGPLDTLIAAHAKASDLILVTNNTREFERVEGLQIENWV